jgi:ABC-type sugar transport system ATPase subunit
MTNAIEVQGLTKCYGDLTAVDDISFAVHRGEVFGFLGPNGAGKTTTQRMLTTLLEPTKGRILINGHDLAHDAYPVKRQMGLVPEESNIYAELAAWNNLMFTAQLYRVPRTMRAVVAWVYLQIHGLDKVRILDARYNELTAELKPRKVYKRTKPKNGTQPDRSSHRASRIHRRECILSSATNLFHYRSGLLYVGHGRVAALHPHPVLDGLGFQD